MREGKFRNCYIPKNLKDDNGVVKLLNFIIFGQYLVLGIVALCTAYEVLRAIVIAIFAEATTGALISFATIKIGYLLGYMAVMCIVVFTLKLTILGVFHFRDTISLTFERRGWLIVSAISYMLIGTILSFVSSEMLFEMKKLTLDADSINSNQVWMIVFVLSICYIYVLGKVQEFRDALKGSGEW
jgi:hypothetical protein